MSNDPVNAPVYEDPRREAASSFFSGFRSGAFNGALMMSLLFALAFTASFIPGVAAFAPAVTNLHFLASAIFATMSTGLFGGIMSAKRALPQSTAASSAHAPALVPVVMSQPTVEPVITPAIAPMADEAEQRPASRKWVETGGENGSKRRIQEIIANGALNDKSRASAILAARQEEEAAIGTSASRR